MEIVVMPKLGFNMDEGKLVKWYKKEGDTISKGEPLFAIETDKTSIDVEGTADGTVLALLIEEGDQVPVTLPIAIIGDKGEDISKAKEDALAQLGGGGSSSAPEPSSQTNDAPKDAPAGDFDYDVAVIGGGPGGYVAAIKSAQEGFKTAIFEKEHFGGVCLNKGCIPTKTFLRSIESLEEVKEAKNFGVINVDAKNAALDMAKVVNRKKEISAGLVKGIEGLMAKNKIKVYNGEAKLNDAHTVVVGKETVKVKNVILATGSVSKGLPGKDVVTKKDIMTSDEILNLKKIPKDIVVIGGGVIGIEFAYFLAKAGSKVTVVEFLDKILPMVDEEITNLVANDLEGLGIKILTSAKVTKVTDTEVKFEKDGKEQSIKTKNVLMAVGRAPSFAGIDVDKLGIKTERGAIVTDDYMKTSVDNIYAIGDCNGKLMLAHTASAEGIVAVENIKGMNKKMNYDSIPSAIYISPEIASVGLTEKQAKEKGIDIKVGKFPLMANGKSKVAGDERGLIKVITSKEYGEIIGAHFYSLHASDMISEVVVAINSEATAEEVALSVHPHPSIAESLMESFHGAVGSPIHI